MNARSNLGGIFGCRFVRRCTKLEDTDYHRVKQSLLHVQLCLFDRTCLQDFHDNFHSFPNAQYIHTVPQFEAMEVLHGNGVGRAINLEIVRDSCQTSHGHLGVSLMSE